MTKCDHEIHFDGIRFMQDAWIGPERTQHFQKAADCVNCENHVLREKQALKNV